MENQILVKDYLHNNRPLAILGLKHLVSTKLA